MSLRFVAMGKLQFWFAACCLTTMFGLGCATRFQGNANFPGGPRGCFERCQSRGMEMAQFVYVGDYSSACVCGPPGSWTAGSTGGAIGTAPAAVGVMTQMAESQARRASSR